DSDSAFIESMRPAPPASTMSGPNHGEREHERAHPGDKSRRGGKVPGFVLAARPIASASRFARNIRSPSMRYASSIVRGFDLSLMRPKHGIMRRRLAHRQVRPDCME